MPHRSGRTVASAAVAADQRLASLLTGAKDISEQSKRHYLEKLRFLQTLAGNAAGQGPRSLDWVLRNPERSQRALLDHLGPQPSDKTVRAYCSSAVALARRLPEERLDAGLCRGLRVWRACASRLLERISSSYDSGHASPRQKENFVSWPALVKRRRELGKEMAKQQSGSSWRRQAERAHLLLAMLTEMPPMRTSDLGSLRLVVGEKSRIPASGNAVRLLPHTVPPSGEIVVREYKTAGAFRRAELRRGEKAEVREHDDRVAVRRGPLPPGLARVLADSVAADQQSSSRGWVFVDDRGERYSDVGFQKMSARALGWAFPGKALTVNMVRHAAATHLDEHHRHDAEVMRYFRYWMMHGRATQAQYVLTDPETAAAMR